MKIAILTILNTIFFINKLMRKRKIFKNIKLITNAFNQNIIPLHTKSTPN